MAREKVVLTPADLAARWDMAEDTLANMRSFKKGPMPFYVGRLPRYRLADVQEYERRHRRRKR